MKEIILEEIILYQQTEVMVEENRVKDKVMTSVMCDELWFKYALKLE